MAITLQGSSPTLQAAPLTVQGSNLTPQAPTTIPLQGTGTPGINLVPPTAPPKVAPAPYDPYAASTAALLAQIKAASQPVYAPKLDTVALNAQARNDAANAVNPYYTKTLNEFLGDQATAKAQEQQQIDMNVKSLQDQLAQTQEANATTAQQTAQDTATKLGDINTASDQYQTDQGTASDQARIDLARQQAEGGVIGSGTATGATGAAQEAQNTAESRQGAQFQEQKDQADLFKNRTLSDILTRNKNAAASETQGETQAKFDLNKYIENQAVDERNKRNELEQSRLQDISSKTKELSQLAFNKYLAGISNPAQYLAAVNTYGGAF